MDASPLELKYANSNISLVFVLPDSRTGLPALEAKLKDYDLGKIVKQLERERYDIKIPKFQIEYEIKLNNVLKNVRIVPFWCYDLIDFVV